VARKLSLLLHRLWVTAEVYDPLYKPIDAKSRGSKRWRHREGQGNSGAKEEVNTTGTTAALKWYRGRLLLPDRAADL
jgi:hypothetical protein